jgi:hypothetical protein
MRSLILTSILLTAMLPACSRHDGGAAGVDLTKYQQERDRICDTTN